MIAGQRRRWHWAIRKLRNRFNPGVPVRVRTRPIGDLGDCAPEMKLGRLVGIRIRIDSRSCFDLQYEKLVHEWAHAMEWGVSSMGGSLEDHSETWGVWYAKIYKCLYDEVDDE